MMNRFYNVLGLNRLCILIKIHGTQNYGSAKITDFPLCLHTVNKYKL